jgi:putative ABC transport system substrate-binding protein
VLAGKRLELLKETIPKISRVAVLWDPQNPGSAESWNESQVPAQELGLVLHSMEMSSADNLEATFKKAVQARSSAVVLAGGSLATANQKKLADLAIQYRLPTISTRTDLVERGVMMSYGSDLEEPYRRVASMVDKILKGTKPADIPVEQPTRFRMLVNLKTAKQIGLTIPPNVLARADRVIR